MPIIIINILGPVIHESKAVNTHEIKTLVQSFHSLVVVETLEEDRIRESLTTACEELKLPLFTWSVSRGLARHPSDHAVLASTAGPLAALRHIEDFSIEGIFLLHDFASHLKDPVLARQFREVVLKFDHTHSCFVVTGSDIHLPRELEAAAVHHDLQLPTADELNAIVESALESLQPKHDVEIKLNTRERTSLLNALGGMTLNQARQSIASALIEDGVLDVRDIDQLHERKSKMIRDEGLLEFFPALDNDFKIGGFDNLKSWLRRAALGFTPQAKDLNLSPPRGIMLTGVQGCGKSLAAKAVAREWNTPLLKLDAASLYNKYIGETERNLRSALKLAESLSPVILWIDEIEKAFATGNGGSDGGTSQRILGSFLTWLQEKKDSIFVVATANDLSSLPPELLRKGRFDEIFFVDLPEADTRREIFEIHLRLKNQDPANFDLESLVIAAGGFSGAEIEQAVVASLYRALFLKRALDTDLLMREIVETVPLSVTRSEDIERIRKHAHGRFVPVASSRASLELATAG